MLSLFLWQQILWARLADEPLKSFRGGANRDGSGELVTAYMLLYRSNWQPVNK
jgi:hypothetical protein